VLVFGTKFYFCVGFSSAAVGFAMSTNNSELLHYASESFPIDDVAFAKQMMVKPTVAISWEPDVNNFNQISKINLA
jgi:hypothetical protein